MGTQILKEHYIIFAVEITNRNYQISWDVYKQRQNSFKYVIIG